MQPKAYKAFIQKTLTSWTLKTKKLTRTKSNAIKSQLKNILPFPVNGVVYLKSKQS